jgi:hypothetical protein
VIRYFVKILSDRFKRIDALVAETRDIEGKLILAQSLADQLCRNGNITDDARRNYAVTVVWAILRNHFLNASVESVAGDLGVQRDGFRDLMPTLPKKYNAQAVVDELPHNAKDVSANDDGKDATSH